MSTLARADVLSLTVPERIQLVQDIWDSIVEVPEAVTLTEAHKAPTTRRVPGEPGRGVALGGCPEPHQEPGMSRRLAIRLEAEQDMTDAFDGYEDRVPDLGYQFLLCVDAVLGSIL